MAYNKDLINWLGAHLHDISIMSEIDNVYDVAMVFEARIHNLIEIDSVQTNEVVNYRLTNEGKRELGVQAISLKGGTLTTDILGYLKRVALHNPYPNNTRSTDSIHEALDRVVDYSSVEVELERMVTRGMVERVSTRDTAFFRYLDTPENAVLSDQTTDSNVIIVLNPTEEQLLRQIAFIPLAANHHEDLEQAVKGLNEYGFIYLSNHNRNWFITKAGEQWLAEHDKSPTETKADTKMGYRGIHNDGYSYIYRDDQVLFIGFLSENAVVELLDTETAALREQLSVADTRMGEMLRYEFFYDKSQPALLKADEYVKEHGLGLGGEDLTMLVIEDARRLRQELATIKQEKVWMSIDLEAAKNTSKHADMLLSERKQELEAVHDQNRDSQIRNGQLRAMLERVKVELANTESLPELHEAIEATLNQLTVDDLPF